MISCTVAFTFNAAKRLMDYDGKCGFIHGYGHRIEVSVSGDQSADLSVDFYDIKTLFGAWIEKHWEHNLLLNNKDKALGEAVSATTGQEVFYFNGDPTAENIARYIKNELAATLLKPGETITSVRVFDTDDAWVEVN